MVYIVVPAYNEINNIGRVVRGLFEHGYKNILVVNDGSLDETYYEAIQAGAQVISHCLNRGQGAALQTGNEYCLEAGAEYIVHFDADNQFNPADIGPALGLMREKNIDVILGSRFLDSRSDIPFFKKYFILPVARLINNVFTGLHLSDAHNGFRILNRRAAEKIQISHDGMAHNSDIVAQIKKHDLNFAECPVEVRYYRSGQGVTQGIKILADLFIGKFSK